MPNINETTQTSVQLARLAMFHSPVVLGTIPFVESFPISVESKSPLGLFRKAKTGPLGPNLERAICFEKGAIHFEKRAIYFENVCTVFCGLVWTRFFINWTGFFKIRRDLFHFGSPFLKLWTCFISNSPCCR